MFQDPSFIRHFPYAGLLALLILGGVGLPFPEDATLILCGFLISHAVVKPVLALLVVYAGLLVADLTLYYFRRKYGRRAVEHKRFRGVLSSERLSGIEARFNRRGGLFILFGRHVAGLRAQLFLAAGILRMPVLKFFVVDAVSSTVTIAIMVGAGYAGGNSLQVLKKDIFKIEHIAVLVLVMLLVFYLFFRYFRSGDKAE